MNRNILRKALGPLAGAAAVLAVLMVALPPAAKALVATLVQVVNTPTNAIPTVHAPAAANLYYSSCSGSGGNSCELNAVPTGQTLFVETISMAADGPTGTVVGGGIFQGWGPQGGQILVMPLQQTALNNVGSDDYAGIFAGRVFSPLADRLPVARDPLPRTIPAGCTDTWLPRTKKRRVLTNCLKPPRLRLNQNGEPLGVAECVTHAATFETRVPVRVEPGPRIVIQGDPDQMEQALIDLLPGEVG